MGEESRDERCQGSTARWKVDSDEVMDKQLRTKAAKSTLLICSDYLMLRDKLPHNLVGIKQPFIMLLDLGGWEFKQGTAGKACL